MEPINCHDAPECFYGPCGYNVGVCCQNGQECTAVYIYNTKLALLLEYHGELTQSNIILKRLGNFTPENEILPKVGQSQECWYQNKLFKSDAFTLHSYFFEETTNHAFLLLLYKKTVKPLNMLSKVKNYSVFDEYII